MSFPLQVCRSSEPGRKAEASGGKKCGWDATGKSEGRTTTGDGFGGCFRFRFERDTTFFEVVVFGLALVLRLVATFRFVPADDFFLVAEEGAMVGLGSFESKQCDWTKIAGDLYVSD